MGQHVHHSDRSGLWLGRNVKKREFGELPMSSTGVLSQVLMEGRPLPDQVVCEDGGPVVLTAETGHRGCDVS